MATQRGHQRSEAVNLPSRVLAFIPPAFLPHMRDHYQCQESHFETTSQRLAYRLYENRYEAGERCLLLLHGAGVAGADTWAHLIPFLKGWRWILVPDLRGMGDSFPLQGEDQPFLVEEAAEDVAELLDGVGWQAMDLVGYSFGGLISLLLKAAQPHRFEKQYLLEPALLDRASQAEVIQLREAYSAAALSLRDPDTVEAGVRQFLDTIAPNRIPSPRAEVTTLSRLAARPLGLSYALDAVTEASRRLDRNTLLEQQGSVTSFIGSRSVEAMHLFHQQLAERMPNWRYHCVHGCDHSLPYQKPRQIAQRINLELLEFLA